MEKVIQILESEYFKEAFEAFFDPRSSDNTLKGIISIVRYELSIEKLMYRNSIIGGHFKPMKRCIKVDCLNKESKNKENNDNN